MDAEVPSPGFTAHRPPVQEKWARVEWRLAVVIAFLTALHVLIGCFLIYVVVRYELPVDSDVPDDLRNIEIGAGWTLAISLLPTLVLLCLWIVAALSDHQTVRRPGRAAYGSCLCYALSWIPLTANIFAVHMNNAVGEWLQSTRAEMTTLSLFLVGALLGMSASVARLRRR